ncbi:hypothetical protein B484DRAFT_407863 [Ochromonadaceae sp. CCMP2298]|nr:hypothetical protein B484DRAFT_407863 [Ochromonadaceae sp. CCMP2298]
MTANPERAVVVFLSGHNPVNREWRSSNTQSDVSYLCCRKDSNLANQTVGDEKSLEYADQRIALSRDYLDLRIRFTLLSASGPGTTVLPISAAPDRFSYPHSVFMFQLYSEDD